MVATRMLRARAVGFITSGATPTSAIAARYPDAPACPTDEYRIAAAKIKRTSKTTCSIATHPTLSPCLPRRVGVLGSWRILREFIAGCYRGGAAGGPAPRGDSNEHLWNFWPSANSYAILHRIQDAKRLETRKRTNREVRGDAGPIRHR